MKAMIIYDTGEGIIIYRAVLTEEEAAKMQSLHNRYGGTSEMTAEEDQFLGDIENSIGDITKLFDATDAEIDPTEPVLAYAGARIFVTGFVP